MTDTAAAAIMCSSKANYSWDLVLKKFGTFVFVDKRDEENVMDFEAVSETSPINEHPLDDDTINGVRQLMKEGLKIKAEVLKQCQNPKKFVEFDEDDPHQDAEDQKMIHMGYKYKLFKLSDAMVVCIRCCINFYNDETQESSNLFVLPHWNTKRQPWEKDLDMATPVMLTKEIGDNSCKFNRWTMQSIICGLDRMRFAFVMRVDGSPKQHRMVAHTSTTPLAFANQINLQVNNCWAILRDVLQTVLDQTPAKGDFLYMKEINQPNYRLIHMLEPVIDEVDSDSDDNNYI